MTQEEKDLLLKDLCARLPYGVNVNYRGSIVNLSKYVRSVKFSACKPYLRPMSSMTEEEKILYHQYLKDGAFYEVEDFCNERHFDYRELIEKGLAIAVTEENNPYKE